MGDYEQYRNTAWTIDRTMCVIDLLREQNKHRAGLLMPKIVTSLQEICTMLSERGEAQVQLLLRMAGALQEYLQAQEYGDDLLCADLLEGRILPLLYEIQSQVPQDVAEKVQAQRSAGLAIELTASGFYTLRYQPKQGHGFYLHGNTNPMADARKWVASEYDPQKSSYLVWGLGLGYHVRALQEISGGSVQITVYEPNREVLRLAEEIGVVPETEVTCIYDPDGTSFAAAKTGAQVGLLLHYPSIRAIENEELRSVFFRLWVMDVSGKQNAQLLLQNFYRNRERVTRSADALDALIKGRQVLLIAAGPSLDLQMPKLSAYLSQGERPVVIAVGTVYRKLLHAGIRPDVVIFMDAQERTMAQLRDLPESDGGYAPLVIDSTAHFRAAMEYPGEVYLACQEGFAPAQELAAERGVRLYHTGGSVTTLALDLAIQCGARRITTIGMDLAYTGNQSHAADTADRHETTHELTVAVKSWGGGEVQTSELFNMYRTWIEKRIAKEPDIEFINATEGGAYVEGMKHEPFMNR